MPRQKFRKEEPVFVFLEALYQIAEILFLRALIWIANWSCPNISHAIDEACLCLMKPLVVEISLDLSRSPVLPMQKDLLNFLGIGQVQNQFLPFHRSECICHAWATRKTSALPFQHAKTSYEKSDSKSSRTNLFASPSAQCL